MRWALALALVSAAPGCYLSHERPVPCDGGSFCGACVEGSCRHETGEGCGEGEACQIASIDAVTGAIATGCFASLQRPVGAACSATPHCASGLMCMLGPELQSPGFCLPYCCGGAGCPSGMECAPLRVVDPAADAGTPFAQAGVCMWPQRECDVIRQTGCDPGTACYASPVPTCLPPGSLALGSACEAVADCRPGSSCVADEDGTGICRALCAHDGDCVAGGTCELYLPGFFGVCRE